MRNQTNTARLVAILCATLFALPVNSNAQASAAESNAPSNVVAPKFIPAILATILSNVLTTGAQAAMDRLSNNSQVSSGVYPQLGGVSPVSQGGAPCYATPVPGQKITDAIRMELLRTGCKLVGDLLGTATGNVGAPPAPNVIWPSGGQMAAPLSIDSTGMPNYQGVKVSVVVVDGAGNVTSQRAIGDAFFTGEKFRLKVQSSFAGLLDIQHIAPSGQQKQLFPSASTGVQQFMINAGSEVTLPLGNTVYEFSGENGYESLTFNVRDPRGLAGGGAAAMTPQNVYRQDQGGASYYVQPVSGQQAPIISQTVQIRHLGASGISLPCQNCSY